MCVATRLSRFLHGGIPDGDAGRVLQLALNKIWQVDCSLFAERAPEQNDPSGKALPGRACGGKAHQGRPLSRSSSRRNGASGDRTLPVDNLYLSSKSFL